MEAAHVADGPGDDILAEPRGRGAPRQSIDDRTRRRNELPFRVGLAARRSEKSLEHRLAGRADRLPAPAPSLPRDSRPSLSARKPGDRSSALPRSAALAVCGRRTGASAGTARWRWRLSMDKIGPMARSAEDCARIFAAIAGHDPKDRSTLPSRQSRFHVFTLDGAESACAARRLADQRMEINGTERGQSRRCRREDASNKYFPSVHHTWRCRKDRSRMRPQLHHGNRRRGFVSLSDSLRKSK